MVNAIQAGGRNGGCTGCRMHHVVITRANRIDIHHGWSACVTTQAFCDSYMESVAYGLQFRIGCCSERDARCQRIVLVDHLIRARAIGAHFNGEAVTVARIRNKATCEIAGSGIIDASSLYVSALARRVLIGDGTGFIAFIDICPSAYGQAGDQQQKQGATNLAPVRFNH